MTRRCGERGLDEHDRLLTSALTIQGRRRGDEAQGGRDLNEGDRLLTSAPTIRGRRRGDEALLVCVCAAILSFGAGRATGADWPHWRGPDFDGKTRERLGEVRGLTELWNAEAGIGFSSFSVVGGRTYTMGYQNGREIVWCYDAVTGDVRWSHSYPAELHPKYYEGGPGVTPTVAEEAVYVLGKQGQTYALHPATGAVIWQRDLKAEHGLDLPTWHFAGSAYLHGDLVIFNAGAAGMALDRRSGRTVWMSGTEATGYSTPVPMTKELGGRDVLGMFLGRAMSGIAARDGRVAWTIPWKGLNATDPIVEGREILVSSIGGSALMRRNPDGAWETVWKRKDFQNYFNPSVKIGDYLYGIDGTTHRPTRFVCIEWATGRERWREEDHTTGGIIATADYLILCDRGEILIARPNPDKLDLVLRQTVLPGKCWTAPVVANGRIYARNAAGRVVCLEPLR